MCHFHHTWVSFLYDTPSIANILKCIVFLVQGHKIMRNTRISNIQYICIMGWLMFRHRKLVVASMLYIDITLLIDAWWPSFSFDKSVPLQILYLLTKKQTKSEYWKFTNKVTFLYHHTVENFNHPGHPEFAKKGVWTLFLA